MSKEEFANYINECVRLALSSGFNIAWFLHYFNTSFLNYRLKLCWDNERINSLIIRINKIVKNINVSKRISST